MTNTEKSKKRRTETLNQKLKLFLASRFGSLLLRVIHASLRWEKIGITQDLEKWADGTPIIGAFWHGRQLMIPWLYLEHKSKKSPKKMFVLISQHNDGKIISSIIAKLGIDTVFGSSSHGGANAARSLVQKIQDGHHICFTPDGPRGPRYKSKQGVLSLAMLSGAPIYPVTYSAERYWQCSSWDKMIIPKPFSRAVYIFGEPLRFPANLTEEEQKDALNKIDNTLNELTEKADNWFKKK